MSALATASPAARAARFFDAPIGKKAVMAVTGAILFGFVTGHLIGNLQIYLGPGPLNHYAELLRGMPGLLWIARTVLLASVVLHIVSSVQLTRLKQAARPAGYVKSGNVQATYASRTMMWSGPIIVAFLVYHLLDFTFGTVNPNFQPNDVYANVVASFRVPAVAASYIVAMLLLGMHLYHGLWSMFQSLGISHPRYTPLLKRFAAGATAFIVVGNVSIPVSVMLGIIGL